MGLDDAARTLLEGPGLAHLATIDPDGHPQVSAVWVGLDGDDIVFASLGPRRKLDNIARDPRVTLSVASPERNPLGLQEYLVVTGVASIHEGGGPELLQRLAQVYLGPGATFPPVPDPPPGVVVRIEPLRIGGVGPWTSS